jgi:SHS2 domain-containing protein
MNPAGQTYKIIDDVAIADVAFEVYGKTIDELFENAALAIFEQSADVTTIRGKKTRSIDINSQSLDTLLFDFLSELLYVKDAEQFLGRKVKVHIAQDRGSYALQAEIVGDIISQNKHTLKNDIKAITYHMFKVEETPKGWVAFVVVDI